MDSSFKTILVKDACIADITDDLTFAVESGASSNTYQSFPATSPSNSSLVFSVQLPSESIVMGRDVLLRTALTFRIPLGSAAVAAFQVPVGQPAFKYGVDCALAPFPFASLITTASVQISRMTTAGLHAFEFGFSLVKLMITDRIKIQTQTVHGLNGRFIVE